MFTQFFERKNFDYSAEIFNLATDSFIVLPDHEVRSALIATDDPEKQMAALTYARQDPRYGLSFFKEIYQDLWKVKELNLAESNFLAAAVTAGVEQGETQLEYIQHGLELSANPQPWLYLMALTGAPEFFPCLKKFSEKYPEPYLSYLSLTGNVMMLDVLLTALKNAYQADSAAEAWFFLTGQQLPLQPNIFLVNEKNLHSTTRPNLIFAERYIAERAWEANQRYFFGLPFNEDNLKKIFHRYGGKLGDHISNLLRLRSLHALPTKQ